MTYRKLLVLTCILVLTTSLSAQPKIPVRDFFRNPEQSSFQISPDGKFISYLAPYERRMNIWVTPRDKSEPRRLTAETARDIPGYIFKSNEHIVYVKDNGGDENYRLLSVNVTGGEPKDLTPFDSVTITIVDGLEHFPDEMLIGMNKRNKQIFDVYRVNIRTGDTKLVAENPGNITGWVTDHTGSIRVAITTDGVNTALLYRDDQSQSFREVLKTTYRDEVNPLFFTFDNKYLYASSNLGRDKKAIVKFDIANGKEMEVLFEHPDVDVSSLNYSEKYKKLMSISFTTAKRSRKFLETEFEAIYNKLQAKLPNYEVGIGSMNKEEDIWIVRSYSDRSLGANYLYDVKGDKLTKLADLSPWLNENDLVEMKPITYTSRDGLTIHGYLTLPKNSNGKNLPVVINPHGGPWSRNNWGFNPEAQLLANRGYAVLQMNFRGSTGYGRKFWAASFKQWGKTMQDDITDGVQWLVKEGIADPKRVAIYGASYGGYATLAGMTFTPDLYACGIDYVGVSNLFTFLKTIPPYWKPYLEMFQDMIGDPVNDKALLEATSPVFHVDKIKAPLLVIQGAKDPRVNIDESNQIVEALKKRGIEVPYIVKENEGHGFRNEENRFEVYEAIESFLDKHLN